jgi:hypothetical protein
VSENGQKLIGHMVLRKSAGSGSSSSILGLKVVGGKLLEDGSMGAVIEKVKRGSTADIEGQLRPGKRIKQSSNQADQKIAGAYESRASFAEITYASRMSRIYLAIACRAGR